MTPAPANHAAIALFLYNRPDRARRAIDALRANILASDSDLYVFCDGPKLEAERNAVAAVREMAHAIDGFRSVLVTESAHNRGIANSIIDGVSGVCGAHERVIVIEDDVVLSPKALRYFNAMLAHFESVSAVHAISGFAYPLHLVPIPKRYPYDVYFTPRIKTWGWATWCDRWRAVNWDPVDADDVLASPRQAAAFRHGGDDLPELWRLQRSGRIDSWAIRWDYHQFRHGGVSVHPRQSYVACIGLDGSGTHRAVEAFDADRANLSMAERWRLPPNVTLNRRINWAYKDLYDRTLPSAASRRRFSLAAWWMRAARRHGWFMAI